MAALTLPKESEPGMALVISLSNDAFQELVSALQSAPLVFRFQELTDAVTQKIKFIPSADVEELLGVLSSLHFIRGTAPVSTSEFIDDVTEAVEESDLKEELSGHQEQFKQRLASLLEARSVAFTTQARSTQRDYGYTFCSAQVRTDIRPIFEANEEGKPVAAVLVHTLRMGYHEGNSLKHFYVALTSDDLDELEDSIEEARDSAAKLKLILDAAKLPYPEDEQNPDARLTNNR